MAELVADPAFQFTGTSALKIEASNESNLLDDMLTVIFQIGGKLLWPNDNAVLAVGHVRSNTAITLTKIYTHDTLHPLRVLSFCAIIIDDPFRCSLRLACFCAIQCVRVVSSL